MTEELIHLNRCILQARIDRFEGLEHSLREIAQRAWGELQAEYARLAAIEHAPVILGGQTGIVVGVSETDL